MRSREYANIRTECGVEIPMMISCAPCIELVVMVVGRRRGRGGHTSSPNVSARIYLEIINLTSLIRSLFVT